MSKIVNMKNKFLLPFVFLFFNLSVKSQEVSKNVIIPKDSVYIKQLDRYRKIRIYLPPNYQATDKRYPVLYMTDAQNLFDDKTSYVGEWNVDEILDSLYEAKGFELIIVGIDHGEMKRINEYSPWDNKKYGKGEGKEFGEFLVNDLKPMIDKTYRTLHDKENTGIMGSSLGGFMAHYMMFEYPEIFGRAGIYSPSYWYAKDVFAFTQSKEFHKSLRFYILIEDKKRKQAAKNVFKMEKLLRKLGYSDDNMRIINDEEAKLLESMFKSASVMVRFSVGEYANQWVPIQLLSSKYTQKTVRKDRLFQYTVNYRLANNIKSQRG